MQDVRPTLDRVVRQNVESLQTPRQVVHATCGQFYFLERYACVPMSDVLPLLPLHGVHPM